MPAVLDNSASSGLSRSRSTVADLLNGLGGIPADRILMQPVPGTATESDLLSLPGDVQRMCELIDGTLVIKAMGAPESAVATCLMMFLAPFVLKRRLIVVLGPDGHTRFFGNQVRMPDVAVILRSRLPNGKLPNEQICPVAPDLAVEVLSPRNTPREIEAKLQTYFDSGVRIVWIADARQRTVRVYSSVADSTEYGDDDTLDVPEILPGFALSIREWFDAAI